MSNSLIVSEAAVFAFKASLREWRLSHIIKAVRMYRSLGKVVAMGYLRKLGLLGECYVVETRRLFTIACQLQATKGL